MISAHFFGPNPIQIHTGSGNFVKFCLYWDSGLAEILEMTFPIIIRGPFITRSFPPGSHIFPLEVRSAWKALVYNIIKFKFIAQCEEWRTIEAYTEQEG